MIFYYDTRASCLSTGCRWWFVTVTCWPRGQRQYTYSWLQGFEWSRPKMQEGFGFLFLSPCAAIPELLGGTYVYLYLEEP